MGCIYTGINHRCSVHGSFKIGKTEQKYPTGRLNANGLTGVYYLSCPNATNAQLLLLESVARCECELMGLRHTGNTFDWFSYDIARKGGKMAQAVTMATAVMARLVQECENRNIRYEVRACYNKGRAYSCAAAPVITL